MDRLLYRLGEVMVYEPLKNTLGFSKVRAGYTAGEAIGPETCDFYLSLRINLKQLFGEAEVSMFITQSPDGQVRSDTVGVYSTGVDLRIAEDGEVFTDHPALSCGISGMTKARPAPTTPRDGWRRGGRVHRGRHRASADHRPGQGCGQDGQWASVHAEILREQAEVFPQHSGGGGVRGGVRDVLCVHQHRPDDGGNWAERNNIAYGSYQQLSQHPGVLKTIGLHLVEVNRSLAADEMLSGCQVHRYLVLHKELDADDGEMTRTRKMHRGVIGEKFADYRAMTGAALALRATPRPPSRKGCV